MKKVIEQLERAEGSIMLSFSGNPEEMDLLTEAINYINNAIAELKAPPSWETPEQRKERTGEEWPDRSPVYVRFRFKTGDNKDKTYYWGLYEWHQARRFVKNIIICATEAGCPPDDWEPEGAQ
jgi:hypothetical protein